MNRKYTGKGFVSLVKGIRRRVKDFALSTDVIVGFPGESEPQFLNTLKAIKSVTPMRVHIFPFSPRPGTRGCRLDGRVDERQVKERCGRLRALAGQCRAAFLGKFKGRKMELLVETRSKGRPGLWEGYTPNYVRAAFKSGKAKPNALVRVTLEPIFQG
jgi:threonylcarbamoyladenosine tRNA methylthiotransferase MtaB